MPIEEYVNKVIHGKALETIRTFPDESLDCVITSPPYWQLRDYKWNGQWGLEPTFLMYLENLWSLMDEIWRVLKDNGTVWINLGDTYNGAKQENTSNKGYIENTVIDTFNKPKQKQPDKCLLLIPHRFAIGCIDRGWIVRNDIIWAKRNGMPESCTDRFSKKHEYIFLLAKSERYYFDLDAIRDKVKSVSIERYKYNFTGQEGGNSNNFKGDKSHLIPTTKIPSDDAEKFGSPRARQHRQSNGKSVFGGKKGDGQDENGIYSGKEWYPNPDGKNPGDVSDFWDITTKGSSNEHYAAYNNELIDKPILSGCPKGGIILDPFCGTATTLIRAKQLGRKAIGIEGSDKYVDIANIRLEQARGIHRQKDGTKIIQEKLF